MGQYLTTALEGALAILTFKREKGINILSSEVLKELEDTWNKLEYDVATRVCILCGEGHVFIAGADIKEMAQLDPQGAEKLATFGQSVFSKIEQSKIISIAAMHGAALGGGCELALACDIRLAAKGLKIGQPEVNLGLIPGFGGTQRLPRIVGLGNAMSIILSADALTAEHALQVGLVTHVSEPEVLMDDARRIAGRILERGPLAIQLAKQCIRQAGSLPLDQGLALERAAFGKTFIPGEGLEGMRAFIEKRSPQFGS